MAPMEDFDVEVQDDKQSTPEQFSGNVATAGSPATITPTSGNPIQLAFIHVPSTRDPDNPNAIGDAIKFSTDGGTNYTTLMSGESQYVPGVFANLKLDTNENGTTYQVIVWT